MMEQVSAPRPSFTSFWKKGKQKLRGKAAAAAASSSPSAASATSDPKSGGSDAANAYKDKDKDKEKAQLRRAQVRRAQIEHRQRKANYTKQLELDISELRDLVALAEKQTAALFKDNYLMREALELAGVPRSSSNTNNTTTTTTTSPQQQQEPPELFADVDINDLTVTLSVDSALGTPCFQIRSNNSSGASVSTAAETEAVHASSPARLSAEHECRAVNFILGLEHCCWNHFFLGDSYSHHTHTHTHGGALPGNNQQQDDAQAEAEAEAERGHALMASAFCMAAAPETIYTDRAALLLPPAPPPSSASPSITTINTNNDDGQQQQQQPRSFAWDAPAITLDALHSLASSLHPGDVELTPVQAWFELASRYPTQVLLGGNVLDTLQREFNGVARCVYYGAVIERLAFESIIARVLGPTEASLLV